MRCQRSAQPADRHNEARNVPIASVEPAVGNNPSNGDSATHERGTLMNTGRQLHGPCGRAHGRWRDPRTMTHRARTGAALLCGSVLLLTGCASPPPSEPAPSVETVVNYHLLAHCGLDHLRWEGEWFTLQSPQKLRGLHNSPEGWDELQPGTLAVFNNGDTLGFMPTGVASLQLVYSRDDPQPTGNRWMCL